jgi:hypothetical protein
VSIGCSVAFRVAPRRPYRANDVLQVADAPGKAVYPRSRLVNLPPRDPERMKRLKRRRQRSPHFRDTRFMSHPRA